MTSLSSLAARIGGINFDDLQWEKRYNPTRAYAQSKSANLMFALELDRQSQRGGWGIVSNAAHPGFAKTNLQLSGPSQGKESPTLWERFYRISREATPFMWQEVDDAILPALYGAASPDAKGGTFYGPHGILEMAGGGVTYAKVLGSRQERGRRPSAVGDLRAIDRSDVPLSVGVACPNPASSCGRSRLTAAREHTLRGCCAADQSRTLECDDAVSPALEPGRAIGHPDRLRLRSHEGPSACSPGAMFVKVSVERKADQDFSALACFPFGGPGSWVYQQAAATTGLDPAWDLVTRGAP